MKAASVDPARIRSAWEGRVSGCQLGKPVELLSMSQGRDALETYLRDAGALPLRDYVPLVEGTLVELSGRACCRGQLVRAEPDDDINYTVLALLLLEEKGTTFDTIDVARAWLRLLPAGVTWTAERAAYRTLLARSREHFPVGGEAGFDLEGVLGQRVQRLDRRTDPNRPLRLGLPWPPGPRCGAGAARRGALAPRRGSLRRSVRGSSRRRDPGGRDPRCRSRCRPRADSERQWCGGCRPSRARALGGVRCGGEAARALRGPVAGPHPQQPRAGRMGAPLGRRRFRCGDRRGRRRPAGTRTATAPRSAASSGSSERRFRAPGPGPGRAGSVWASPAIPSSRSTSWSTEPSGWLDR